MEKIVREYKMSDIEIAVSLIRHIENPCKDEYGNSLLPMWIETAKHSTKYMENPFAIGLIENSIRPHIKNQ